jgi:hypothetical protein
MAASSVVALGLRTWIKATIEKAVDAKFERELEGVRSDLRLKEAKITSLQSNVLGGKSARRAILDKRRLEALENLWSAALKLDQFQWAAKQVSILKLDELEKRAVHDPKVRQFLTIMGSDPADLKEKLGGLGSAQKERLFVPTFAWKVFEAYQGVLVYCYARLSAIATGLGDTEKLLSHEKMIEAIKEVMPHLSAFLDQFGVTGAANVVDPLRELLLQTIVASFDAEEGDEKNLSELVRMFQKLDQTMAESLAAK